MLPPPAHETNLIGHAIPPFHPAGRAGADSGDLSRNDLCSCGPCPVIRDGLSAMMEYGPQSTTHNYFVLQALAPAASAFNPSRRGLLETFLPPAPMMKPAFLRLRKLEAALHLNTNQFIFTPPLGRDGTATLMIPFSPTGLLVEISQIASTFIDPHNLHHVTALKRSQRLFAIVLPWFLEAHHLSQAEFSAKTKIRRGSITSIIHGNHLATPAVMESMTTQMNYEWGAQPFASPLWLSQHLEVSRWRQFQKGGKKIVGRFDHSPYILQRQIKAKALIELVLEKRGLTLLPVLSKAVKSAFVNLGYLPFHHVPAVAEKLHLHPSALWQGKDLMKVRFKPRSVKGSA